MELLVSLRRPHKFAASRKALVLASLVGTVALVSTCKDKNTPRGADSEGAERMGAAERVNGKALDAGTGALTIAPVKGIDKAACCARLPIVYSEEYDMSLLGIEELHPFDTKKYGKVYKALIAQAGVRPDQFHVPEPVSDADLLLVHSSEYLTSLLDSEVIAAVAEMPALGMLPVSLLRANLLKPMKFGTGGTILGAELAMRCGWAINLSGGYHHAKAEKGEGFCYYADIPIAVWKLWQERPQLKVLIVDLDAHQGNGHESIFGADERVDIFDIYNGEVYPQDEAAREFIDYDFPLDDYVEDEAYLALLMKELPKAIEESAPGLIIYNAGTDVFELDPLGGLGITDEGIVERDEFVFQSASVKGIPVLMVLSGGYAPESAGIIGRSVRNLFRQTCQTARPTR